VAGITFKENVNDIRNSRVIDIINELKEYGIAVMVADPLANAEAVEHEYGIKLIKYSKNIKSDAIIIAVNHDLFRQEFTLSRLESHMSAGKHRGVVVDVKGIFSPEIFKNSKLLYWRL